MKQNRSSAVMQQRSEPHDSLEDFPTPSWGTRAFIEHVLQPRVDGLDMMSVWETACNRGYMARPLKEYFGTVYATDIHDYGWGGQQAVVDFLFPGSAATAGIDEVDWVISNPPFRLAEQFIERAKNVARVGFAFVVRTSFLESVGRHERLYKDSPPAIVAQYSERIPMLRGRVDPDGSTATSYAWLVWIKGGAGVGTELMWIPPCRKQMERDGDYDVELLV